MNFIVRRGEYFLRLEGPWEYERWMLDAAHATRLFRSKASTYADLFDGEVVEIQG